MIGHVARGVRAAMCFLTRVPMGNVQLTDAEWRWAPAYFPLVGAGVGAVGAAAFVATTSASYMVAAVLAVGATIVLTGGFHEDGLADTADALGGAHDRDKLFEILKDSRLGTFGVAALAVSFALRAAALAHLGPEAPAALIAVHCFARVPPIWLMASLPYVSAQPKSRAVFGTGPAQVVLAAVWPALLATYLVATNTFTPGDLATLAILAIAIAFLTGWRYLARAGGLTGDFLGATEQLCECTFLLALAL